MILEALVLVSLIVSLVSFIVSIMSLRRDLRVFRPSKNVKNPKAKRYIIVDVVSAKEVSLKEVESVVRSAVKEMFGMVWLDLSNPRVIYYLNNKGIISTTRIGYRVVLASLPKTYDLSGGTILVVPRKTTGSVKKAKKLINLR